MWNKFGWLSENKTGSKDKEIIKIYNFLLFIFKIVYIKVAKPTVKKSACIKKPKWTKSKTLLKSNRLTDSSATSLMLKILKMAWTRYEKEKKRKEIPNNFTLFCSENLYALNE